MTDHPPCPHCAFDYPYENGEKLACPECGHEWLPGTHAASEETAAENNLTVKDSNGAVLQDGDTVVLIKDLKVKGTSGGLKVGTRVKNIRLIDGDHNIDCRIDGIGAMRLKSEFVRKG